MQRMYTILSLVALMFFAIAAVPANISADCDDGWTFVNDGPCAIKITVTPDGPCLGNQISFVIPAQSRLRHREVCCIKSVKIELGGPCFGTVNAWPVSCNANSICTLPAPFNAVSVGECGVKLY